MLSLALYGRIAEAFQFRLCIRFQYFTKTVCKISVFSVSSVFINPVGLICTAILIDPIGLICPASLICPTSLICPASLFKLAGLLFPIGLIKRSGVVRPIVFIQLVGLFRLIDLVRSIDLIKLVGLVRPIALIKLAGLVHLICKTALFICVHTARLCFFPLFIGKYHGWRQCEHHTDAQKHCHYAASLCFWHKLLSHTSFLLFPLFSIIYKSICR